MLDTARFKYPPHWLPVERLFAAMTSLDGATGQPRGWLLKPSTKKPPSHRYQRGSALQRKRSEEAIGDRIEQALAMPGMECRPTRMRNSVSLLNALRNAAVAVAVVAGLAASAGTAAADADETPRRYELTAHAGYRIGGELEQQDGAGDLDIADADAQGLLFDFSASANTQWEVLYARQDTRLEMPAPFAGRPSLPLQIEHVQFGGTYLFDGRRARPFLALTAGVSRFDPGVDGVDGETYFSGSLAGGVQLRAEKRIGVRLEGRVFGNLIESDEALFCQTGFETNVCALAVDGTALYQWEARAGVVFRF